MAPSALIEIGTEELPLDALEIFYTHAAGITENLLKKNRLTFGKIRTEATPRRLVFFIENLTSGQGEEKSIVTGPAHDKAFDAAGKPTPALEGFLRAHGAKLEKIKIQESPRGRYVAIEKVCKGEPTAKLLPRLVLEILAGLPFRKTMRWEKSGFRFPRPVQWVAALFGKKVISFSVAGVKTGRISAGHRFLAPKGFSVSRADWAEYEKRLRQRHVLLGREDREQWIRKELEKKFRQKNFDPDLIRETAGLVEEPFLLQGKFSGTYRDLPEEVLATCMKKHQKIFACRDEKGSLVNRFVAVLNGGRSGLAGVRRDFENVLESRLRDAQYFYDEDTKEPLEKKAARLGELVFIGKLGTVAERTERLRGLVRELAGLSGRSEWEKNLDRVAQLAKADLTTQMVGEFPELQGVVGREYAREAGEPSEVARAIGEQYLPKNLSEGHQVLAKRLSPMGALFGIADRIDLLTGAFGVRLEPTGSEDPYALRRAAGSAVKLIRAFSFRFSLAALIQKSRSLYQEKSELSFEELFPKLAEFFKARTAFELELKPGTQNYEILQGVMKSSFDDLADVFDRFEMLERLSMKQPKVFFKTSKVVERTGNILKGIKEPLSPVDPGLFQDPLEKGLFEIIEKKEPGLRGFTEKKDYEGLTRAYGEIFFDPLHEFFDRVMVNVDHAPVRRNRQALMRRINRLYTEGVADLSLLTQVKE